MLFVERSMGYCFAYIVLADSLLYIYISRHVPSPPTPSTTLTFSSLPPITKPWPTLIHLQTMTFSHPPT
jgi:hypothetical protein